MKPNNKNNQPSSFQLPQIPSHLIGESALIDKETGQVYWQGGRRDTQSLLSSSPSPSLLEDGSIDTNGGSGSVTYHLKSSILTGLLMIALFSMVASWVRSYILRQYHTNVESAAILNIYYVLKMCTLILCLIPKFHPWLITFIIILYFLEAYNCNTRQYIKNIMSCNALEQYMDELQLAKPEVTWKVRCFHYENRSTLSKNYIRNNSNGIVGKKLDNVIAVTSEEDTSTHVFPNKWSKKVLTHELTKQYNYTRFEHKTMASTITKPSRGISKLKINAAPFAKITLSKVLLLSDVKTREDYFMQQSAFVSVEGRRDTYAEFSTNIQVKGFQPKILAIRHSSNSLTKTESLLLKPYFFWICTCLGLTLPFRIYFHRHCDELRVTLVKETYKDTIQSSSSSSASNGAWFFHKNSLFQSLSSSFGISTATMPSSSSSTSSVEKEKESFRNLMRQYDLYQTNRSSSNISSQLLLDYNNATVPENNAILLSKGQSSTIDNTNKTTTIVSSNNNQTMDLFNNPIQNITNNSTNTSSLLLPNTQNHTTMSNNNTILEQQQQQQPSNVVLLKKDYIKTMISLNTTNTSNAITNSSTK